MSGDRVRLSVLVALLISVIGLGGLVQAAPVEIEFFYVANQSEDEVWKALVDQFNSEQSEIQVMANWDASGWGGFEEKALVRLAGGDPADIMRLSDESFGQWVRAGYLLPLDSYVQRDRISQSLFLPVVFPLGTIDGRFYGFPQGIATRALAYNTAMFDGAGLAHPDDQWRWDKELLSAAKKLSEPDAEVPKFGILFWFGGAGVLRKDVPEMIWSWGGEVFDPQGQFLLNTDASISALQFLADLRNVHRVYPDEGDVLQMFANSQIAMWNTGIWDVNLLRQYSQMGLEWDFAPTPGGPAGYYSFIQGNGIYVIPQTSPNPDAAWEFMKFLASEEAQHTFSITTGIGGAPLRKSLLGEYTKSPAPPTRWDAIVTSLNRGRIVNHPPNAQALFDALDVGWSDFATGLTSARNWINQVTPTVLRILSESK